MIQVHRATSTIICDDNGVIQNQRMKIHRIIARLQLSGAPLKNLEDRLYSIELFSTPGYNINSEYGIVYNVLEPLHGCACH